MNCPVCNVSLTMTFRENVEIDYCPKCRGVWLDRGEIEKIIAGATRSGEQSFDRDDNDDDDYRKRREVPGSPPTHYPQKKKKGFLGEIFDWD